MHRTNLAVLALALLPSVHAKSLLVQVTQDRTEVLGLIDASPDEDVDQAADRPGANV